MSLLLLLLLLLGLHATFAPSWHRSCNKKSIGHKATSILQCTKDNFEKQNNIFTIRNQNWLMVTKCK